MVARLKSGQLKSKEIVIFLPYMKDDYLFFKLYDVLFLNKVLSHLGSKDIKVHCINLNECNNSKIGEGMELIKRLTAGLANKQGLIKNYVEGEGSARLSNILRKLIGKLKLTDNQIIVYYQPNFNRNLYTYLLILKEIKRRFPDTAIICAAGHLSRTPEDLLNKYDFIDYISDSFNGGFLREILEGNKEDDINGIAYRNDGRTVSNFNYVYDLNGDRMPNYFGIIKQPDIVPIEYSFGCPYKCFFCDRKGFETGFQLKNIDLLVEEIERHSAGGVHAFWFCGAAINIDEDYIRNLCEEIIERNIKVKWSGSLIPFTLRKSTYNLLHRAGCVHFRIGVETVNQDTLISFGKNITLRSLENCLKYSQEANIKNTVTSMVGLPRERELDVMKKMAFIKKHKGLINSVKVFIFRVQIGAPVYQSAREFGLEIRPTKSGDLRYIEYDEIGGESWDALNKNHEMMLNQFRRFLKVNNIPEITPEEYFINFVTTQVKKSVIE